MKKTSGAVYYFLGILEALAGGVFFFLAGKDEEPKILNLLTGVVMTLCGAMHMNMGAHAFKDAKAAKAEAEDFDCEEF